MACPRRGDLEGLPGVPGAAYDAGSAGAPCALADRPMRSRLASSRVLFFLVLAAIAAVFLVGRYWMQRSPRPIATEAGVVGGAGTAPALAK